MIDSTIHHHHGKWEISWALKVGRVFDWPPNDWPRKIYILHPKKKHESFWIFWVRSHGVGIFNIWDLHFSYLLSPLFRGFNLRPHIDVMYWRGKRQLIIYIRPLKFNMKPENQPPEKEIPALETIIFRFQPLNLGGVHISTLTVPQEFCWATVLLSVSTMCGIRTQLVAVPSSTT